MNLYTFLAASAENIEAVTKSDNTALIVGILAFAIGLGGLISSIIFHISTNKVNLVINKREEWKEKLRKETTTFCTMVYAVVNNKNPKNKTIYEIVGSKTTIELMLNLNDKLDNIIKRLLEDICNNFIVEHNSIKEDELDKVIMNQQLDICKTYFQIYLKTEWERIKNCSKLIHLRKFDFNKKAQKYYNEIGADKFIGYQIDWEEKTVL